MNDQKKLLTQGSVWQLTKALGTDKNRSTVLCVTNLHLSEELQERFPPVVVFFSKPGEFSSMLVDDYLSKRTWVDVDNEVSAFQFSQNTKTPEEPTATPEVVEKTETRIRLAVNHELEELLNTAFVSYEEAPELVGGDTFHILTFDADEIDFQDLISVFSQPLSTSVPSLSIMGLATGDLDIVIQAYVNTYLKTTSDGKQYAVVHLVTPGDFRADLENRMLAEDKAKLAAIRRAQQAAPLAETQGIVVMNGSPVVSNAEAEPASITRLVDNNTETKPASTTGLVDNNEVIPPFQIEG